MDTFSSESKGSSLTMKSKIPVSLKISLLIHFGYQYFMVLAESSTDLNYYLFTMGNAIYMYLNSSLVFTYTV